MLGQSPVRRRQTLRALSDFPLWSILGRMALLALLSRAHLCDGVSPFAPACFAAALSYGYSPFPMLMGCAAGCLSGGYSPTAVLPLFSCMAAYAVHLLIRLLSLRFRSLKEHRDAAASVCALSGLMSVGLAVSGRLLYNILTAVLGSIVSALLAPSLRCALGVRLSRKRLTGEEQLSLALLILILLCGVCALPYVGSFAGTALCVLLTLFCASAGSGMGALGGIAAGSALMFGGAGQFIGPALSLCGMLAGVVRKLPRACAAFVMLLGSLLTIGWGVGGRIGVIEPAPLLVGGMVYCLLPASLLVHLRAWLLPPLLQPDPERMSVMLRRQTAQKLDALGDVFGELADGYHQKSVLPGEQQIILKMRRALCEGCEGYADCWQGEKPQAGRLMCRLLAQCIQGKQPPRISELPPDLLRHCRRSAQIEPRVMPLLRKLTVQRRDALKRGESISLLGAQLRQAQQSLTGLSMRMKSELCLSDEYAQLAHAALDQAGLTVQSVTALLDDRIELICLLRGGLWDEKTARIAARAVGHHMGVPFSPVLSHGRVPGEWELRLLQAPSLSAVIAAQCIPAQSGMPCGDSHIACLLPDGRLLAAVSDGMGHGEKASEESQRCISMLRKFICADIEHKTALSSVNRLLLLQGGEEMFATVDLCEINLYSGIAHFSKLAANRTFILQEKEVLGITGGRLPLGILESVEPAQCSVEVYPGDVVIMTSDGIADELKDGQMDELQKLVAPLRSFPPDEIAARILAWAQSRGGEKDDMTAIVFRILQRR